MKLKGVELVFLSLALAAVFFAAGYFTGRGAAGDVDVTVEKRVYDMQETAADDGLVDLNTAGRAELTVLPGIGETLADRIIEYREEHGPFTYVEELLNVQGLGETVFDAVADMVTV